MNFGMGDCMNVIYSKTGSDGNASVISDGETLIQIDAGIKPSQVNSNINYRLLNVAGVIIDHAHSDHMSYANDYILMGIPVYVGERSTIGLESPTRWITTFTDNEPIRIKTFIVQPFRVPHTNSDGTDCPNYGFLIGSTHTKERMLWATDCSYIEQKFPALDYICVECSYIDVDDYFNELKYINPVVEKRRLNSHMSLERCVEFLKNQDLSKCKEIRLLHLTKSQGNIKEKILKRMNEEFPKIKFIV